MTPWRSVGEFCDAARARAAEGDLNGALEMIVSFVISVIQYDSSLADVFSSPELDSLALELGKRQGDHKEAQVRDDDRVVFLVTGIAPTGGHSRVLLDLIDADPATKVAVLVTNTEHDLRQTDVEGMFEFQGGAIEIAPSGNLAVRLAWLQRRLTELRPARTYIFTHHYDPLCVAAAQPELVGRLIYYHHCDHSLAMGVHLHHATHIDFNGKGFHHCREVNGICNNVFWPLTANVPRSRDSLPFMSNGGLTTCTSGGIGKVEKGHLFERIPYLYEYAKILPLILQETRGVHIHIGDLSEAVLAEIEQGLVLHGVPLDRFVHVHRVPNLAEAMIDRSVDVYVGSFPSGGGRATVEAMGAGLPLILHSNYRSVFFSDVGEAYPGALCWRTPADLSTCLARLTPVELEEHARRSRSHYETHHAPDVLRAAVRDTLAGQPNAPPRAPAYHPNRLQNWLDGRVALNIELDGLRLDRQAWQDRAADHERRRCELERSVHEAERKIQEAEQEILEVQKKFRVTEQRANDSETRTKALARDRQHLIDERTALRETFAWPIFTFLEKQTRSLTRLKQASRRGSRDD